MKIRVVKSLLVSTVLAGSLAVFSVAQAEDIPVDRVILSTSGLANFELRAHVKDDATLQFPVRYEQVDDILKSLLVFDRHGSLGGVTLPGKQPLAQVFKDLPFTQQQLENPMLLLNAYQGADVTLKGEKFNAAGKLLQVVPEEEAMPDERTVIRNRISVMTDAGMKQAVLEDLQSVSFDDPKIKAEISRALDAIRENGASERRLLTVNLIGKGERDVDLAYVVDAPLWKSAYRMVVPEAGQKKGLLQGWAVIENMTASDWKNVDLTLVSGNPVTFRQNLYQSYYVSRPEIPVQVFGRVMPRVDDGVVATAQEMQAPEEAEMMDMRRDKDGYDDELRNFRKQKTGRMEMKALKAAMPASAPMAMGGMAADSAVASYEANGMGSVAQAANAAGSAEATTQVLFRFPNRFSLKSGQSMMLPFVSREAPMERVSLYQPETHPTHPLAAVELTNDGETGLPPGVLTLYEESPLLKGTAFVGDAQLPVLAQGEKRLVSYALDSKTTIDRADKSVSTQDKFIISKGIMRISVKSRNETVYTIKAPAKEARTVILEHPKQYNYEIVSPDPKEVEVTATHYRIRAALKAGEKKAVAVVLENETWQSYSLTGMSSDQFAAYASSSGKLDPATRRAFAKLAEKRREVDAIDQKIYAIDNERNEIFNDQQRLRENLKSLNGKSEIQQKYLAKLNVQEDRIERLDNGKKDLAAQRQQKMAELSDMADQIRM